MESTQDTNPWTKAFIDEMAVQDIITKQGRYGCWFDERKAKFLIHKLTEQIVNVDIHLVPQLPPMMNKANEFKKPFLKSGKFSKYAQIYADAVGLERHEVGGPFTRVWYTPFDPSKTAKIKEVMFEYGWIPDEWNEKKMDFLSRKQKYALRKKTYAEFMKQLPQEDREHIELCIQAFLDKHFKNKTKLYMRGVLRALGFAGNPPTFGQIKKKLLGKGFWPTSPKINPEKDKWASEEHSEIASLLRERMQCSHRKSLLEGLLKVLRDDHKVSGEANACATPTARMRQWRI